MRKLLLLLSLWTIVAGAYAQENRAEKREVNKLIKNINDYIWTPQQLVSTRNTNPERFSTFKDERVLVYGKITDIVENFVNMGIYSEVLYSVVLDSSILIYLPSAKEAPNFSVGDNVYALVTSNNTTEYEEELPTFTAASEKYISTTIKDIVHIMRLNLIITSKQKPKKDEASTQFKQ